MKKIIFPLVTLAFLASPSQSEITPTVQTQPEKGAKVDHTIEIYTTPSCVFCVKAKELLDQRSLSYQEIDVSADPTQLSIMTEKSGGKRSVPQIFVDGKHIGGYRELHAMENAKLDSSSLKPE